MRNIGTVLPKIDADAILLGAPVYVDDFMELPGTVYVKAVRSPYAHARIVSINKAAAEKIPGVVGVFTHEDTPVFRYSANGCNYPETHEYDRRILDDKMRYVGDEAALVAAETPEAAERAAGLIKVKYEILPIHLTARGSLDSGSIIHDEKNVTTPIKPSGMDLSRNLASVFTLRKGDTDEELKISENTYSGSFFTQAQAHAMLETLRSYTFYSPDGRLTVIACTQAPYHTRRQVAFALGLPISKVHVIKQRVGGGFGGKKVTVVDPLTAFVTYKTGRPAKMVLTRKENFTATTSRHEMSMDVDIGADANGHLRALKITNYSNTGAYAEEGPAVTCVVANNILPSYNRTNALAYTGYTIYTNIMSGAALRGYGATQGGFVVESAVNELCYQMNMDPYVFRYQNMIREGDEGGILHSRINSCALDRCMKRGKELFQWEEKYPARKISNSRVRAVGMAITTHRTSIPIADKSTVTIRLEIDGRYLLLTGAADLGTGADTVLMQIAAETLKTSPDHITIISGDTDSATYDSGAFASSTTYVAGNAVVLAANSLIRKIRLRAAELLETVVEKVAFDGQKAYLLDAPESFVALEKIGISSDGGGRAQLMATETYVSREPPITSMAGFVEIELDLDTGKIIPIEMVAVADCGKVINPALCRTQAEGGIMMGLGLSLYEEVIRTPSGRMVTDSYMQYKIPCREDAEVMKLTVEFEESFEPSGPFGAKSIGEATVHVVAPAIQGALLNAAGIHMHELPFTPEKVWRALQEAHPESGKPC